MTRFLAKSNRQGISNSRLLLGAVLWVAVFLGLATIWQQRPENSAQSENSGDGKATTEPAPGAGVIPETIAVESGSEQSPNKPGDASVNVSFPAEKLPDFSFDESQGGKLSLDDLKGHRWVASFVFTRCTSTCPTISRAMKELHDRVIKDAPDVKYVSFTVDPKYDTVEVLKNYAQIWTSDTANWKFVTGEQQQIYELIVNGFGQYVAENLGESRVPGFEVAHSNRVVLVNEEGLPVGRFLGTRDEDMVKLRRILTGREEFPKAGPGLTFSIGNGEPLQIQFQVQPANLQPADPQKENTQQPSPEPDSPTEPSDNDCSADEAPSDSATASPRNELPENPSEEISAGPPFDATTSVPAETFAEPVSERGSASAVEISADAHNAIIDQRLPEWAKLLPAFNASLNLLSVVLLVAGLTAIKCQHRQRHRNLMVTAFVTSAAFLSSYLLYHYALGKYTGEHGRRFRGDGLAATIYPLILWPHVVLAVFVPALAIRVFQHAFAGRWDAHKKLARITFPIWMFVSITGVVIYGMLYHWPGPIVVSADP